MNLSNNTRVDDEQQWASTLARAKQKKSRARSGDTNTNARMIERQLETYKTLLFSAIERKDDESIRAALRDLISTRALQLGARVAKEKALLGSVRTETLTAWMREYYTDCIRLVRAATRLTH